MDFSTVTSAKLLACAPEWETQIVLLLVSAAFWFFIIPFLANNVVQPWLKSKSWCDQWTLLNGKTFEKSFFIKFETEAETFGFGCIFLAILAQHGLGGVLCVPSLVFGATALTSTLACFGGLCEAGWELQDAITRTYQVLLGGEAGLKLNPLPLRIIMGIHHVMGMSMVVPMNIYYHDNAHYHEFILLLQFAAFVALALQNYGYTLDVKSKSGLAQMKIAVTIVFITILWSRVLRYGFIGYSLAVQFHADGHTFLFYWGSFVLCTMGLLNTLFFMDALGKFVKFIGMKADDKGIDEAVEEAMSSHARHNSILVAKLTTSQKEWAKIKGAVRLGAFHKKSK
jgi:hypothetical protein